MSYWPKNEGGWHEPVLFIHIPKTAGISVQNWYRETYGKFHKCMHGDVNHHVLSHVNARMKSWCVVRNPYDLVHSWYRYKHQMLQESRHRDADEHAAWRKGFEYWLEHYIEKINYTRDKTVRNGWNEISPSKCQWDYISTNGKQTVDFILKFENLQEDIEKVNFHVGCYTPISHANKTIITSRDYRKAHTSVTKKIVEKYYSKDLEYFNYDF